MAASDRRIGTAMVVTFTPDGGTARTLSADFTAFNFDRSIDTVDVTAGNETSRYFKGTIEGMEWGLTLFDASQTYKDDLVPGTIGVLNIKPVGAGTGLEEIEFNTLLTGYSEDLPFDGALEIELSGTRIGDMVKDFGSVQA